MVVFHPPYSFRRLGQTQAIATAASEPKAAAVNPYDQKPGLSVAALAVAGIAAVGLAFTISGSLLRRE